MRTTINLDDEVFRAFKRRAAERGSTLAREIDSALRADLATAVEVTGSTPYVVPVFAGRAPRPGVDINSNAALHELLGP